MSVEMELPKYKCHKEVWALKIAKVVLHENDEQVWTGATITPEDERYAPFEVDAVYVSKHMPDVGGYYVKYEGGYESWSPAEAFEDGYSLIDA